MYPPCAINRLLSCLQGATDMQMIEGSHYREVIHTKIKLGLPARIQVLLTNDLILKLQVQYLN